MAWVPGQHKKDRRLSQLQLLLNKISGEKFLPVSMEVQKLFREEIMLEEYNDLQQKALEAVLEKAIRDSTYVDLYINLLSLLSREYPQIKVDFLRLSQKRFQNQKVINCELMDLIAELYLQKWITTRILMVDVIYRYLISKDLNAIQALTRLMVKVTSQLKQISAIQLHVKEIRKRLELLTKDKTFPSRIRFLVMDVLDLF
jgi:hypothetical protein